MGNCFGGGGGRDTRHEGILNPVASEDLHVAQSPLPSPQHFNQKTSNESKLVPTFDEGRLKELSQVVPLRETMLDFVKHGRCLLDEVADSCAAPAHKPWDRTAKGAHALKGAAKTVGAARIAHHAEIIERSAKQGEVCDSLLGDLEAAFEDLAEGISRRVWS